MKILADISCPYLSLKIQWKWQYFGQFVKLLQINFRWIMRIISCRLSFNTLWCIENRSQALAITWSSWKFQIDFASVHCFSLMFWSRISYLFFFQHYSVYWNCSGCYYFRRSGSKTVPTQTAKFLNLQRGQTYLFTVHAVTNFGSGENSTVSVMISRYFGQVLNLKADVDNYIMTIQWDKPSNIEAKDIKVLANPQAVPACFDFVAIRF